MENYNVFAGAFVDRTGERRKDRDWLDSALADEATRFVPVWGERCLVADEPPAAVLLARADIEAFIGIDNVIFIAILVGRVDGARRESLRRAGLVLALVLRILLLLGIEWIMSLTDPILTLFENELSGRDLILLAGGAFLIAKSTHEIHEKVEGELTTGPTQAATSAGGILLQIILVDVVFSLDSVITAVGMVKHIPIMVIAMVVAMIVMLVFADAIAGFIEECAATC